MNSSIGCRRSAGGPHRRGPKRSQSFLCVMLCKIAVILYVCNHGQFYKLNVYFCFAGLTRTATKIGGDLLPHPQTPFMKTELRFGFLSLTALFLFCAPQSRTQIAHASRPRRRSQRSSRRRASLRSKTPHSLTKTSSRKREEGWKKK